MGTLDAVIPQTFWEEDEPRVLLAPGETVPAPLEAWLLEQPALSGHVLFRTSGSTAAPKYVCLSRHALRFSAEAVNVHLQTTPHDRWLGALPRHHVGGFGIMARASVAGLPSPFLEGKWEPSHFCATLETEGSTLTSLVPTQVYDLVLTGFQAPASLRAVLVGGGALPPTLEARARDLGWPLLQTFGMTETASQIATQPPGSGAEAPLHVLPGWEVALSSEQRLRVRGPALFSGYVRAMDTEGFRFEAALSPEDPWFTTEDRVSLGASVTGVQNLRFLERTVHRLKIKGELVDLQALRQTLSELCLQNEVAETHLTLTAASHSRDGQSLVVAAEPALSRGALEPLLLAFDQATPAFLTRPEVVWLPKIPRTDLGKLDERTLREAVDALTERDSLS